MTEETWVIRGQPEGTAPVVGHLYEIRDSRKGTFNGKVVEVAGNTATIEVTEGEPRFASLDYRLGYNGLVKIRASLAYLIELPLSDQ